MQCDSSKLTVNTEEYFVTTDLFATGLRCCPAAKNVTSEAKELLQRRARREIRKRRWIILDRFTNAELEEFEAEEIGILGGKLKA